MKTKTFNIIAALVLWNALAGAQGTAFTYQGRLNDGTNPASGLYDINFTVYDAPTNGNVIGGTISKPATDVSNGFFTVTVDFGAGVFNGSALWLQLGVRTNGSGSPQFTTISPRQPITAAPYAITARDVSGTNVARLNVPNTAVQATGHPIVSGGAITSAVVDNGGSGYTGPVPVTISPNGPGSGGKITATVSGGSVVALNVTQPGSGYTSSAT